MLLAQLPDSVRRSVAAYIGCVAGASLKQSYLDAIKEAGFSDIQVLGETGFEEQTLKAEPILKSIAGSESVSGDDLKKAGKVVRSIKVSAIKPGK